MIFKLIEIKIYCEVRVILQFNGRNQFPTRKTKLFNSAVHVELVASDYVSIPNQGVFRFDNLG